MNKYLITKKNKLAENIFRFSLKVPRIARKRQPGQFVIIRLSEEGERIPLTIAAADESAGTIDIIVQAVGKNTVRLSHKKEGDEILDVAGPLGNPTEIEKFGKVVAVGGGVGVAPLLPIAKGMKDAGNELVSIIGARAADILILEEDFKVISDRLEVVTDDGSKGRKGFVTDALREEIESSNPPDLVIAVGPVVMMRAVSELTKKAGIKTIVSLNPIMIDGTGMCGGCRVTIAGETKFACVDGPEFDAHKVDFDGLIRRLSMFKKEEKHVHDKFTGGCRLNGQK